MFAITIIETIDLSANKLTLTHQKIELSKTLFPYKSCLSESKRMNFGSF